MSELLTKNGNSEQEGVNRMNNNEAISQIRFLLYVDESDGFTRLEKEALNMAISALSAGITTPPKSNGDRIRQMTDEELAEFLEKNCSCPNCCDFHPASCKHIREQCIEGYNKWLRQEIREDETERID